MPPESTKPISMSMALGHNVHRLRKEQGMKKKSFAMMVGIGRPLLDKIESGESDVRLSYVQKLADGLGVSPLELLAYPPEPEEVENSLFFW